MPAHPCNMPIMANRTNSEQYRPIPSYPDYGAAKSGSVMRLTPRKDGIPNRPLTPCIVLLKGKPSRALVGLFPRGSKRGVSKTVTVARLVLETWVGVPPKDKWHAAHKNGDATDNRLENLYWATPKQNIRDQFKHGTFARGEKCHFSKLTDEIVRQMRRDRLCGLSWRKLGAKYGCAHSTASNACVGRSWGHIT